MSKSAVSVEDRELDVIAKRIDRAADRMERIRKRIVQMIKSLLKK
jgi:hypothetical protein